MTPSVTTVLTAVWPHAFAGRFRFTVPRVIVPVLSRIVALTRFATSDWLKQPKFVRDVASTVMPALKERELEPANSSAGTVVPNWPFRTSVLMMKRLLASELRNVTAPPPEY